MAATIALGVMELSQLVSPRSSLLVVSLAHVVLGLYVFLAHGGPVLTPSGFYYFSAMVFVGLPGLYLVRDPTAFADELFSASLAILLANLLICLLRFRKNDNKLSLSLVPGPISPAAVRWSRRLGLVLMTAGLVGALAGAEPLLPVTSGLAFVGAAALLGGTAVAATSLRAGQALVAVVLAIAGLGAYLGVFFRGFGRINVVVLVLAGFLVLNAVKPRLWQKPVLVLGLVPALLVAGLVELQRAPTPIVFSAEGTLLTGEGLESGIGPLQTFADLVREDLDENVEGFPRMFGFSELGGLAAPIPRELWVGKPAGLGALLAQHFVPGVAAYGHSMAALAYGEWYIDFWWFGFMLLPVLLASVLRQLDAWQRSVIGGGVESLPSLIALVCFAVVTAGLVDYVWVGTFTFMARGGIRAAILAGVWLTVRFFRDRGGRLQSVVRSTLDVSNDARPFGSSIKV